MAKNTTPLQDVDDSNVSATLANSEIIDADFENVTDNSEPSEAKSEAKPETTKKVTNVTIKAKLLAVDSGQSDDTALDIFFRLDTEIPRTDENGIHKASYSFGKGIQLAENLLSIYPQSLKIAFRRLKTRESQIEWLVSAFQILTDASVVIKCKLIADSEVFRGYSHNYEWWAVDSMNIVKLPPVDPDALNDLKEIANELRKEEKESTTATAPQWTTLQQSNG